MISFNPQVLHSLQLLPSLLSPELQCEHHHLWMEGQQIQRNSYPDISSELHPEAEQHQHDEHQEDKGNSDGARVLTLKFKSSSWGLIFSVQKCQVKIQSFM